MAKGSNFIEIKGLIDSITHAFELHKKTVQENIQELERLQKAYAAMPSEFIKNQKSISDIHRKQSTSLKNLTQKTAEHIQNEKILRRNVRETGVQMSNLTGAYDKVSARLNKLRRDYSDLAIKQEQGEKLTKDQVKAMKLYEREAIKLDKSLKKVDAATGKYNRSVGNYAKAWSAAGNLVGTAIQAFGIYSGIQVAGAIYRDIKAVDAMNKALKQVTETQENFNQAKAFLNFVADESGQNIVKLTGAYNKFYASARTTNLTLGETQNIFRQVSKAAGVLGLSADDAEGALRALEQMLSKGKVQAEEIRGQLGERLPGAFQILAKSMGLTTSELDKQLRDGKVLADEVLPEFAKELERTYSLDKINKVKTLVSEQERLSNAWTGFVETLTNSDGIITKALTGTLGLVTKLAEGLKFLNMSMTAFNEDLRGSMEIEQYNKTMALAGKTSEEVARSMKQQSELRIATAKTAIALIQAERKELEATGKDAHWLTGSVMPRYSELEKQLEKQNKVLGINQGVLKGVNEMLGLNTKETAENSETLGEQIKKREKLNAVSSLNPFGTTMEEAEKSKKIMRDVLDVYQESSNLDTSNMLDLTQVTFDQQGLEDFINTDGVKAGIESLANELGSTYEDLNQEFDDYYERDYENFLEYSKKKIEVAEKDAEVRAELERRVADNIIDTVSALFDNKIQKYEEDIEKSNEYYDTILENDRISAEQRKLIEQQKRRDQEKLEKEKQKEEEKQFLFQQGVALAQVAIETAKGIATATAQAPLTFGASLSWIPLIIAAGATQAGLILAQTIPAFAEGVENSDYEGPMLWGEVPGKTEVKIGKNGVEIADKPTLGYIKKGETIYSSIGEAINKNKDIQGAVWQMNMSSLGQNVTSNDVDYALLDAFSKMETSNRKVWKEVKNLANRPIYNNVTIESDKAY